MDFYWFSYFSCTCDIASLVELDLGQTHVMVYFVFSVVLKLINCILQLDTFVSMCSKVNV